MLRIESFGLLRVLARERDVSLTGPLTRTLLAWLVLREGEHTLAELKRELNAPDLRAAVHVLKRLEGSGAIRIKPGRSGSIELLRNAPGVYVDYDEFKQGIRDDASRDEQARAYELAITGELFQGLEVNGNAWQWLSAARQQQAGAIVRLCRDIADACESEGNLPDAALWSARWYEREPTNEVPVRLLANRLTAIDDHSRALDIAESYLAAVTARGVTPSEGFTALLGELQHGRTIWRRSTSVIATIPKASEAEFVHREIMSKFRTPSRLARDERQIVFVEGEAGVGKTRLCAEIVDRWASENPAAGNGSAIQRGAVAALYGRFDHEAGEYSAFGQALLGYLQHWTPLPQEHDFAEMAPELTRIPSLRDFLRDRMPSLRHPSKVDDGTDRSRLFTAIQQALQRIAQAGPVLLVLDDLHEADRDSLALLGHCVARTPESPLMYLCTYRPTEAVVAFVQALSNDHPDALRFKLVPFDASETRDLASSIARRPLSSDEVADVLHESGGLPLEIEEIARTLELEAAGVSLDTADVRLLGIASLIGSSFTSTLLADVAEVDLARVEKAVAQATEDQTLLPADGAGVIHFSHLLRRRKALDTAKLEAGDVTYLSHRAADALSGAGDANPAQLARLYRQAGDLELAARYLRNAAEDANEARAYEDAAHHLEDALDLDETSGIDSEQLCDYKLALGEVQWSAGRFNDATNTFVAAAKLARQLEDAERLANAALGFAGRLGFQGITTETRLTGLLADALEALPADRPELRARLQASLAQGLAFGTPEERLRGQQLSNEARQQARELNSDGVSNVDVIVDIYSTTGWATWRPDNLDERKRLADQTVEFASEINRPARELESRILRICIAAEIGDREQAEADLAECAELAELLRLPFYRALVKFAGAMIALLDGPDDAMLVEALEIGNRHEHPGLVQLFGAGMLYYGLVRDCLEELLPAARDLSACYPEFAPWRAGLALIYAELGELPEAQAELRQLAENDFALVGNDMFSIICWDHIARTQCVLYEDGRATRDDLERTYSRLEPYRARFVVAGGAVAVHWSVEHTLGLLASALASRELARQHFRRALAEAERIGCRPAVAAATLEMARTALVAGGPDAGDPMSWLRKTVEAAEVHDLTRIAGFAADLATLAESRATANEDSAEAGGAVQLHARASSVVLRGRPPQTTARAGRRFMGMIVNSLAARAKPLTKMSEDQLDELFGTHAKQRAVFGTMAKVYRPDRGFGFEGEIEFELILPSKEKRYSWTVVIRGGEAMAIQRRAHTPQVVVRLTASDFVALLTQSLNGVQAWLDRRIQVDGDTILAARLVEMFGGEAALVVLDDPQG